MSKVEIGDFATEGVSTNNCHHINDEAIKNIGRRHRRKAICEETVFNRVL
jgi:hypothetical protein